MHNLNHRAFIGFLLSIIYCFSLADEINTEQKTIDDAVKATERCYYWGGETGTGNQERENEVGEGAARDCPPALKMNLDAYKLYPTNSALIESLIKLFEADLFRNLPDERKVICKNSFLPLYKKKFAETKKFDREFLRTCPDEAFELYGPDSSNCTVCDSVGDRCKKITKCHAIMVIINPNTHNKAAHIAAASPWRC